MIVEKMFGLSVSNAQTIVREQGIIDTPENERVSEVLLTAVSVIVAEIENCTWNGCLNTQEKK